jgi:hypothetical protein
VSEPAKVFEDRLYPGDWRVEWEDDDGGVEVTIFSGPDARARAFQYADWRYRVFTEPAFGAPEDPTAATQVYAPT